MKQKLRLFTSLLLLAVASAAWGETATENISLSDGQFATDHIVWNGTSVTVQQLKGNVTTAVNKSYIAAPRVYKGHILSFEAKTGYAIKSISITYNGTYSGNSMTAGTAINEEDVVTDNTTDVSRTWSEESGGTHVVSSVSEDGLPAIYIQNVASDANVQLRPTAISVTYVTSGSTPATTYTVSFDAGEGTFVGNADFPAASNTKKAGTYTLPSATPATGYTFDGWLATGSTEPVTGSYTVSGDVAFTAQYTQNSSSGSQTATLTSTNLELTGTAYSTGTKEINGITYSYTDLMPSNNRIQAKASTGTIKNVTPYPGDITSVVITHNGTARATTINGSADGENWTQVATGSGSITADFSGKGYKYFQITRGSNAAYWDKIEITYSETSLEQSDLTITNATTDLAFDLYNNTEAQVINYTTSSTGEVTISPAESDYFTILHDAANKQITVTPTAVTPGAQTVTIRQAADETYNAGAVTFTVTVTDSTPFEGSMFIFNTDEGLTELGITKPETGKGTDLDEEAGYTKGIVTMSITHGGTNTRVWNGSGNTDLRVYKDGGSLTFTVPAGNAITKVTFEGSDIHFVDLTDNVWTASGNPVNTVTFTNGSTGSKINTIKVEYEEDNTPMLSAKDVDLAYDATSGSIEYTLTNEVAGGVVSAESSESWLSVETPNDGIVALTCSANSETTTRTATVTLSYSYGNNASVSKEVIVTQAAAPLIYTTIPALFKAATSTETDVKVTFGGWVISAVKGSNAYLTDNQGHGLIIYTNTNDHGFNVGDVLTGTASCKLQLYRGSAELTNLTNSNEGLTVTTGGTLTVQTIAISELSGVNTGALLAYEGLTYNGTALVDGDNNTITPFTTLFEGTFEEGCTYNVTGIYQQYNTTKDILPRSAADIVEVVKVTITAAGYATFANAKAVDFTGTGVKVMTAQYANGKISYTEVTSKQVPAGAAVILQGTEETYYATVITEAADLQNNDLQVNLTESFASNGTQYCLAKKNGVVGFYKVAADVTVKAGKAYLVIEGQNAKDFYAIDDETTGISQMENGQLAIDNAEIYNLSGQRVNKAQKGIYIVNGKKVVIR